MIRIEKLSKHYGKKQVLQAIDLSFTAGKAYGIIGENGAGKTTLFKCIAGLESYEGQITSGFNTLKDHIGLLLTEPYFFSKITGREYIQLLTNARNIQSPKIDERNIFDLPLDQYAATYSTGMKKKLALTAILLQKNDVFILDEPFNGVDIQSNLIITAIIAELKALGKTLLISSHTFSTLADSCDELYVLEAGAISKKILPKDYDQLELEMKDITIGKRLEKLDLK
jgi:ABC-2 type transport system ATP-binding protein